MSKLNLQEPLFTGTFDAFNRVYFFPDYREGNAYQSLLYAARSSTGAQLTGIRSLAAYYETIDSVGEGDLLHLHWVNMIYTESKKTDKAQEYEQFLHSVERAKRRGATIYWTIHNHISHDVPDKALEATFRQRLASLADRIFHHHPMLIEQTYDWLQGNEQKVSIIEHGSYPEEKPDEKLRLSARKSFGFDKEDCVLLILGQIRPNKEIYQYLPAISKVMASNPRLKLLVAGQLICDQTRTYLATMPASQVVVRDGFVPGGEIGRYFQAATYSFLSYGSILTSGSLFQSLTCAVPVIAPRKGAIPYYVANGWNGWLYSNASDLEAMLENLASQDSPEYLNENAWKTAQTLQW